MCYRGGRTGADGREFAGFESVEGGVRGILALGRWPAALAAGGLLHGCVVARTLLVVDAGFVRYTSGVSSLWVITL